MRLTCYVLTLTGITFLLVGTAADPSPMMLCCLAIAFFFFGANAGADLAHWQQRRADRIADAHALARSAGRPEVLWRAEDVGSVYAPNGTARN